MLIFCLFFFFFLFLVFFPFNPSSSLFLFFFLLLPFSLSHPFFFFCFLLSCFLCLSNYFRIPSSNLPFLNSCSLIFGCFVVILSLLLVFVVWKTPSFGPSHELQQNGVFYNPLFFSLRSRRSSSVIFVFDIWEGNLAGNLAGICRIFLTHKIKAQ